MSAVEISYKGEQIASMDATGVKTLLTGDTFCEDDIVIQYTAPSAPTPTGTKSITISAAGTTTEDVTNYASAEITVPSGSAATPATAITANPTISVSSTGLITASVSGSQSVTPSVSAGYVSSGTAGTVSVSGSNTSQLTTQAAQTITPTTTDQTIASGKYLTGAQTIKGDANLVAANIADGVTIFGVTGTHQGGGGTLITKTVTANGVYNASSDNADGYSTVTVNVSGGGGSIATTAVFIPGSTGTTICYTDANMTAHKETSNGSVSANLPIGSIVTISNTSGVPAFEPGREPTGVTQLISVVNSRVTRAIIYKVDDQSL